MVQKFSSFRFLDNLVMKNTKILGNIIEQFKLFKLWVAKGVFNTLEQLQEFVVSFLQSFQKIFITKVISQEALTVLPYC